MSNQIKERPILFSAPMVRAILEGRKTITRRALSAQALKNIGYGVQLGECHELPSEGPLHPNSIGYYNDFCPYGQPGDRLWVRETTEADHDTSGAAVLSRYAVDKEPVLYSRSEDPEYDGTVAHWDYPRQSRPSIHMHRWASRILLEITDVRLERLRAGEGETANESRYVAEGIHRIHHGDGAYYFHPFNSDSGSGNWCDPFDAWRELWVSINSADSWNTNPWVWVVEFKRVAP